MGGFLSKERIWGGCMILKSIPSISPPACDSSQKARTIGNGEREPSPFSHPRHAFRYKKTLFPLVLLFFCIVFLGWWVKEMGNIPKSPSLTQFAQDNNMSSYNRHTESHNAAQRDTHTRRGVVPRVLGVGLGVQELHSPIHSATSDEGSVSTDPNIILLYGANGYIGASNVWKGKCMANHNTQKVCRATPPPSQMVHWLASAEKNVFFPNNYSNSSPQTRNKSRMAAFLGGLAGLAYGDTGSGLQPPHQQHPGPQPPRGRAPSNNNLFIVIGGLNNLVGAGKAVLIFLGGALEGGLMISVDPRIYFPEFLFFSLGGVFNIKALVTLAPRIYMQDFLFFLIGGVDNIKFLATVAPRIFMQEFHSFFICGVYDIEFLVTLAPRLITVNFIFNFGVEYFIYPKVSGNQWSILEMDKWMNCSNNINYTFSAGYEQIILLFPQAKGFLYNLIVQTPPCLCLVPKALLPSQRSVTFPHVPCTKEERMEGVGKFAYYGSFTPSWTTEDRHTPHEHGVTSCVPVVIHEIGEGTSYTCEILDGMHIGEIQRCRRDLVTIFTSMGVDGTCVAPLGVLQGGFPPRESSWFCSMEAFGAMDEGKTTHFGPAKVCYCPPIDNVAWTPSQDPRHPWVFTSRVLGRCSKRRGWSMEGGVIMGGGCAALHHHVPSRPFSVTLEVTGNDSNKGPVTSSASPLLGSLAGAFQAPETKPHPPVADKKWEHGQGGVDVPFSGHFTGNISHRGPLLACDMHFLPRMGSRMAIGGGLASTEVNLSIFWRISIFLVFVVCELPLVPNSISIPPILV